MTAHDATPTEGPWTVAQPWSGFSEIRGANGELVFGLAAGSSEEKQPDDVCDANAALLGQAWTMRFRTIPALAEENARLKAENAQLRESLANANNIWRHEFSSEVDAAAEKLFKRLSWNNTARAALAQKEPDHE